MNSFDWFLQGLGEAATPMNLLYAVIGVLLGTAVGVLPGIGPAMTVALLLPITYNVSPSAAFIMFAGIFYGGMYGGSTTSIPTRRGTGARSDCSSAFSSRSSCSSTRWAG